MALPKTQDTFKKILFIVLALAFGIATLAMAFKATTSGTDIRSRAAQETTLYKAWEFNGTTSEGWDVSSPHVAQVSGGSFDITVKKSEVAPFITNKLVSVSLPKGNKYITITLSDVDTDTEPVLTPTRKPLITPPSRRGFNDVQGVSVEEDVEYSQSVGRGIVCSPEIVPCPLDASLVGRTGAACNFLPCATQPLTVELSYKLIGKKQWEKPIQLKATPGKSENILMAQLVDIGSIQIDRLRFTFVAGIRPESIIKVNSIHITGSKDKTISTTSAVACTMDAKACPDGTFVGRVAPTCEFAQCSGGTKR